MTLNHSVLRVSIAVSLWMCAALACAQQIPFVQPSPGFDPYVAPQSNGLFATPAESPILQQELPVFLAGFPVRFVVWGEFLYLRASDGALTDYAVPVNGAVLPPPIPAVPMGPVAFLEHDWEPGFRAGFDWVWNDYSRWVATYTSIDLDTTDTVAIDPASSLVLQSLVVHPSTVAAVDFYDLASARGDIEMRLGDIDYRRVFIEDWYRWDFLVGARYAHLDQKFQSIFINPFTTETVDTRVDFDGGGIRFGTRGDWRSSNHGFFLYAQATTSFIAGTFKSRYLQTNSFFGVVANTSREDDRIINITDLELGAGWHSASGRWWFSGGYTFNTWSDVVSNAGLIRAVQATKYSTIRDRLTLDGLAARAEFRF